MPDGGEAKVALRPVAALLPHEEIIPRHAEQKLKKLLRDGIQKDPLIVEREHGVVLDGMHRLWAFRQMKLEYAVCCLVDYSSQSVELRRWVRAFRVTNQRMFSQMLADLGISRRIGLSEAFEGIESRTLNLAIVTAGDCYGAPAVGEGTLAGFNIVRKIDAVAAALGWEEDFVRDDEVDVALQKEGSALVLVPKLTKQDVVDAALSGRLYPFKTTMHIVDPRPVGVDFPLEELKHTKPPKEILSRMLAERTPRLLPPDSVYGGRKYKERLLVFGQR